MKKGNKIKEKSEKSNFSGGIGFVLAAAGSAVGLGNLWRFPYLAAKYGGGIFILVYVILALTFGFTLMTTEIAIGRKTLASPIRAYGKLLPKFNFLGYLAALVPLMIVPYYSVIGGWILKYVWVFFSGHMKMAANPEFFSGFTGQTVEPIVCFILYALLSVVVVLAGVQKGIEKLSRILMPVLVVITVVISVYVLMLPGAGKGAAFYLLPDFSKFSFQTIQVAMGQMFYSMSLAMGIMITYGSYTKRSVSLVKSVNQIEFFDTFIALFAGLMIIPTVYIYAGEQGLEKSGPELMFVAMPQIFSKMKAGNIIGALFFVLVLFAALTSSISIMEALVASLMEKFKVGRKAACAIVMAVILVLGIPSSMGFGAWSSIKIFGRNFLDFFDYISNNVLMPIVAFATCILVGWVLGPKVVTDEVTRNHEKFRRQKLFYIMVKYVAPVLLLMILFVN